MSYLYQVAYDVTQDSQDANGLYVWGLEAEKNASDLGKKVHDLLSRFGAPQMGSTFLISQKKDFSADNLLNGILSHSDAGKEYFSDSERAHIKMTVADVNKRHTDKNRLAKHNI